MYHIRHVVKLLRPKDIIDEIIFKAKNTRNRLIIELMARGGMRISEVLKLTASDIEDRNLIIRDAKSGKAVEHVFIPQKIADRLKQYIREKGFGSDERIFPMTDAGVLWGVTGWRTQVKVCNPLACVL